MSEQEVNHGNALNKRTRQQLAGDARGGFTGGPSPDSPPDRELKRTPTREQLRT